MLYYYLASLTHFCILDLRPGPPDRHTTPTSQYHSQLDSRQKMRKCGNNKTFISNVYMKPNDLITHQYPFLVWLGNQFALQYKWSQQHTPNFVNCNSLTLQSNNCKSDNLYNKSSLRCKMENIHLITFTMEFCAQILYRVYAQHNLNAMFKKLHLNV